MHIGHLAITVKNMEESIRFYENGFGMKKAFELSRPQTGEPWIVYMYMGEGQFLELFYGGEKDYTWDEKDRAYCHVAFSTDDIQAAVKKLEDAGYPLEKQPKLGCDGNWQAWIRDPDGVRVEIMQIGSDSPQAEAVRRFEEE